jgi:hypothetical protein
MARTVRVRFFRPLAQSSARSMRQPKPSRMRIYWASLTPVASVYAGVRR